MFRAPFTCLRNGCGLPLHAHHDDGGDPDQLLHVHATTPDPEHSDSLRLTLKRAGRNGCKAPVTTAP